MEEQQLRNIQKTENKREQMLKSSSKITLLLLCTCFPHDTIDFSVQKQGKDTEINIKNYKKESYQYPAKTITSSKRQQQDNNIQLQSGDAEMIIQTSQRLPFTDLMCF